VIAIGSDHGGYKLKEHLKEFLAELGKETADFGCNSEESCDYPEFGQKVAKAVASGKYEAGILVCGTGIGMSMAANKVAGIRAAVVHDKFTAQMAKEHNNANILCVGGRVIDEKTAEECVRAWLEAEFAGNKPEGERHKRRVEKINKLDELKG